MKFNKQPITEYYFGKKYLGPFFSEFCRRLWLYQQAYSYHDPKTLFCARGGIRLHALYKLFLKNMELDYPIECHDFMISRLLASKVCMNKSPELVLDNIYREFRNNSMDLLAKSFLPQKSIINSQNLISHLERIIITPKEIKDLFFGKSKLSHLIQEHINEQTELFCEYLKKLLNYKKTVVLVDTGLFGSTQLLLSQAYKNIDWFGQYIARSNYRKDHAPHFPMATGLILECDLFSPIIPESALLRYWHIIEMSLEPSLESVVQLQRCKDGTVKSNLQISDCKNPIKKNDNSSFAGIIAYFETINPSSIYKIRSNYKNSINALYKKILSPSKADLIPMNTGKSRSHDFGREGMTKILCFKKPLSPIGQIRKIHLSLWAEGQIVYYYGTCGTLCLRIFYYIKRICYQLFSTKNQL